MEGGIIYNKMKVECGGKEGMAEAIERGDVWEVIDDDGVAAMVEETPVILFCRCEGQGYVYCGRLGYRGHDPARIPVRFVWSLDEYETLQSCPPFQDLVRACNAALPNAGASGDS